MVEVMGQGGSVVILTHGSGSNPDAVIGSIIGHVGGHIDGADVYIVDIKLCRIQIQIAVSVGCYGLKPNMNIILNVLPEK